MIYSYPFTLAKRGVVATLDLTAANLHMLRTNHWLKHSRNVTLLQLTGPAFQAPGQPLQPLPAKERMAAWTVDELANFYSQQDAAAVAEMLQRHSVNGADLLEFENWQQLLDDLNTVPFVAKKAFHLRDMFLAGDLSTL